jgi:uncharacterized protein
MVARWHTREDSGLRLDAQGRWWHDDELIEHPKIIEAFNVGLKPTGDGRYRLDFGKDWCFVAVENAAYQVLTLDVGEGHVMLHLSNRQSAPLEPETLYLGADDVLYCRVFNRQAVVRFSRDAQFALGQLCHEQDGKMVLTLGGRSWPIGSTPRPQS